MINKDSEKPWYLCGPMSFLPSFGIPAFLEGKTKLEALGYKIQLPADLDDPEVVTKLMASPDGAPDSNATGGLTWADCLALDVKLIGDECAGIFVLPGWQYSRGARLETFVNDLVGHNSYYASSQKKVPRKLLVKAWDGVISR